MLKKIKNKTYDLGFSIIYKDGSIKVVLDKMLDSYSKIVDLNTIDKSDLRCVIIGFYRDYIKELEDEDQDKDQELWGAELGDISLINNTAILKHCNFLK